MVSKDYTKELGLKPAAQVVPLPIAIAILAVGGALLWFAVVKLNRQPAGRTTVVEAPAAVPAAQPASH